MTGEPWKLGSREDAPHSWPISTSPSLSLSLLSSLSTSPPLSLEVCGLPTALPRPWQKFKEEVVALFPR